MNQLITAWLDLYLFFWGKHTSAQVISSVNTDESQVILLSGFQPRNVKGE